MRSKSLIFPIILSLAVIGCNNKSTDTTITKVTLDQTSFTLVEGETFTLTATVEPEDATNKNITWSSTDSEIATVDDKGLVSAVSVGTAIIRATSVATSSAYAECEVNVAPLDEKDVDDSKVNLTLRKMEAVYYSQSNIIEIDTYFRDDKLKNTPYMSIAEFYRLFTKHEMTVIKVSDDNYLLVSANGEEARLNTKLDTLQCDRYSNFISSTIYRQDNVTNVYFDGSPFVKVKEVTYDKDATPKTVDFKKYGINLFGKGDDVYIPVATASNLFMGPTMITCFPTSKYVYFIDPNDFSYETSIMCREASYTDGVFGCFDKEKRTLSEAMFSYGELCFLIDNYYGRPGREYLHDQLEEYRDLDQVLENYNNDSRKTKELLLSQDMVEYFAGIWMLNGFLSDAGHSVVNLGVQYLTLKKQNLMTRISSCLRNNGISPIDYEAETSYSVEYRIALNNARPSTSAQNNSYVRKGDTVLYRFDSFMYSISAWENYYRNPNPEYMPLDSLGNLKRTLDLFESDDTVKNFVLDITTNGGGFGDEVATIMGLMGKRSYQHVYDSLEERTFTVDYSIDKNFDGVFDEKDDEVSYHYNFAILCSSYSFSCGNLLPAEAKENGVMILGDRSGGGCCAVIDATSAEGIYIRLSCQNHMCALDGSSVEFGVDADYKLIEYLPNDQYNFSNLYNIDIMSREMNNFYSA